MRNGKRLDPLQDLERGHRRHASAEIANALAPRAQQERRRRRFLGEHHVVKARVRLGQRRELAGADTRPVPVEPPAVDQQAADHDTMTGQELGRRVVDQVRAVLERPHQIGRRERRIDQQRQPVIVRQRRDARHVEHVEPGVAERLAEQQPRFGTDRRTPRVDVARIDERRRDAEARQRVVEQIVRAAVQRARRDDVRACAQQGHDGKMQRRLAAGRRDRADAAFERGDALLEHRAGRIGRCANRRSRRAPC